MSQPIVAYYRVSREKQGRSGLGLDGQRRLISAFAGNEGMEIAGEFTEVETGKGADALERRPQLAAALRGGRNAKLCAPGICYNRPSRSGARLEPTRASEHRFVEEFVAQRASKLSTRRSWSACHVRCSASRPVYPGRGVARPFRSARLRSRTCTSLADRARQ
jgi:hypothetical protein